MLIIYAFCIAVVSIVYRFILSEGILNKWFVFGLKYENRFFYNPIWGCVKCISGQIALWLILLNVVFNEFAILSTFYKCTVYLYGLSSLNVAEAVFFISFTILITEILYKFYINKIK